MALKTDIILSSPAKGLGYIKRVPFAVAHDQQQRIIANKAADNRLLWQLIMVACIATTTADADNRLLQLSLYTEDGQVIARWLSAAVTASKTGAYVWFLNSDAYRQAAPSAFTNVIGIGNHVIIQDLERVRFEFNSGSHAGDSFSGIASFRLIGN